MKAKRPERLPQQTPKEVLDSLLGLVQRKFYQGEAVEFAKDRKRILVWALLWPAREWFKPKAVSLPAHRYQEILTSVIMDAVIHQGERINYRPAWLAKVIQSHFEVHGERIYNEAKALRTIAENTLIALGQLPKRSDGLVEQFTAVSELLETTKRKTRKVVSAPNQQPDLFKL